MIESEPAKVIADGRMGKKNVHTQTHNSTYSPEKSKTTFSVPLYHRHLLFCGLCAKDSSLCLMFPISDCHVRQMNSI